MRRKKVARSVSCLEEVWNTDATNLVVGGAGYWHHLNLGIMDRFYSGDYDVYNLDNHYDTNYTTHDQVDCGNHLYFALLDGKTILNSASPNLGWTQGIRHVTRFVPASSERYDPFVCLREESKDRQEWPTLDQALKSMCEEVYVTIDIDALSKQSFTLRHLAFQERATPFDQGTMAWDDFAYCLTTLISSKNVVGANLFGLCDDTRSRHIYDQTLALFA